jgi:hypothetical protein
VFKTISKLSSISSFNSSDIILNQTSIDKINSTVAYSLSKKPERDYNSALKRCTIAQTAEQKVAEILNGYNTNFDIDYDDPYTYSFDVLAGFEFYNTRIEVKTHQSNSKWITVNTDRHNKNNYMNLYPFLEYGIADVIVIYKTDGIIFNNVFVGNVNDIKPLIKKSNYSGWYLNI